MGLKNIYRFKFGENWKNYVKNFEIDDLSQSSQALAEMLRLDDLRKKTFIDVGSGSGLSSLAAYNLGANVFSFDYDKDAVFATASLKKKFKIKDQFWSIEQGSILDENYIRSLGEFDIVYSWGVLHHTGNMWKSLNNIIGLTKKNGILFIAIYNNQGWKSKVWWIVKYIYNTLTWPLNNIYAYFVFGLTIFLSFFKNLLLLRITIFLKSLNYKKNKRGMKINNDIIDWIGGFPFEYADFQSLKNFFEKQGFVMINSKQASDLGCHELVFKKLK